MTQPSQPDGKHHFIFLRHGESVGNAGGYYQGHADFPLTEFGQKQAQSLAAYWSDQKIQFEKIISSPLSRARETAEIIANQVQASLDFDEIWMERHNGLLAGKTAEQAAIDVPKPDFIHLYQPIGRTGESEWDLYVRGLRAIQSLLLQSPGHYLVVSHGGILNLALFAALGIPPQPNFSGPRFSIRNTGYVSLSFSSEQTQWRCDDSNSQPYIMNRFEPQERFPYELTFIRHAESTGNQHGVLQGRTDSPLSTAGQYQAKALSEYHSINGITYDRIYSSPLERAYQTAEAIAQPLGLKVDVMPSLTETDFGELEGLTYPEVKQYYMKRPVLSVYQKQGTHGESRMEAFVRASEVLREILAHPPGRYLIVSHGSLTNLIMHAVLGLSPQPGTFGVRFVLNNTGMARLDYDPTNHRWRVDFFNSRPHMTGLNV